MAKKEGTQKKRKIRLVNVPVEEPEVTATRHGQKRMGPFVKPVTSGSHRPFPRDNVSRGIGFGR
jgi:hypothetical protein